MIKKSLYMSKNLNKAINYLTPKAKLILTQLKKTIIKDFIF